MARDFKATEVRIPCRLSYAYVWSPRIEEDGSQGKYSASLLIPKTDTATIRKIQAAVEAAKKEGKSKLANKGGIIPNNIHTPLRDADEEGRTDEAYEGMMFLNASSKRKPQIVDRHVEKILDISIHAPQTGSDSTRATVTFASVLFQSTLPKRGATKNILISYNIYFNPRSPNGERPGIINSGGKIYAFQSTLPKRGATA